MEEVPPTGAISAPGALNALGRPAMDFWDLFVRETVQNSWDAKLPGYAGPVRYDVSIRALSGTQSKFLLENVVRWVPNDGNDGQWEALLEDGQTAVCVSDWGTTGLGGSTRADLAEDGGSDFSDFVFNVGALPDKERGGGTYGYGKSVLYRASRAAAIAVYSRCRVGDRFESRFITAALGRPFTAEDTGVRHTGRHWWGVADADLIAPATGRSADAIARGLGIPVRSDDETGTSILVFAAALEELGETVRFATRLSEAALWHCWPKMVDLEEGPDMVFSFSSSDDRIEITSPEAHPTLKHFVNALREVRSEVPPKHVVAIKSLKPKRSLGRLSLNRFPVSVDQAVELGSPIDGRCNHVALMRAPGLVVKYMPGPESSVPLTSWAGVFFADDDADRDFAASETPTHDDWVPDAVAERRTKSAVKVALERIKESVRAFNAPVMSGDSPQTRPLGHLADSLGGLLATGLGTGPDSSPDARTGKSMGGGPKGAVPRVHQKAGQLELLGGARVARFKFKVTAGVSWGGTRVDAVPFVAVNDGSAPEKERPLDAFVPEVVGFWSPDGKKHPGSFVLVGADDEDEWSVVVSVSTDAAVGVSLKATGMNT